MPAGSNSHAPQTSTSLILHKTYSRRDGTGFQPKYFCLMYCKYSHIWPVYIYIYIYIYKHELRKKLYTYTASRKKLEHNFGLRNKITVGLPQVLNRVAWSLIGTTILNVISIIFDNFVKNIEMFKHASLFIIIVYY